MTDPHAAPIQWWGSMFWSYAEPGWCGYFAALPTGQFYLRHEITFHKEVPEVVAVRLKALHRQQRIVDLRGFYAQPEIFPTPDESGETISETFTLAGLYMQRGSANREAAFSRLRSWLEPLPQGDGRIEPSLLVHPSCEQFIRTLPSLERGAINAEDIEPNPDEFAARAASFFVMARPMRRPLDPPPLPPGAIGHDVERLRRGELD